MLEKKRLAHAYVIDNISETSAIDCFEKIKISMKVLDQDAHFITSENQNISVDKIRFINDRLTKSPIGHRHLVGINPAQKLNTSACNALLKSLEEPPGNTCFILFSKNKNNLLPTILSRCQILRHASPDLSQYASHSSYKMIKEIYQHNPGILEESLQGLKLYEALQSNKPHIALHNLEIESSNLIQLSIQIIAGMILKSPNPKLFSVYDKLILLAKDYRAFQNLNEKALLDRIGLIFQHSV